MPSSTSASSASASSGLAPKDHAGGGTTSSVVGPKYDGAVLSLAWNRARSQNDSTGPRPKWAEPVVSVLGSVMSLPYAAGRWGPGRW